MLETIDLSLVNWSRAQFALTAMYHWVFVPLTLGLTFIIAFMETMYVRTGEPEWKKMTKFWMTLFGINFAVGVATGIILEFEFGTNWSNYSWFVGDIFGAPLAIEGVLAFFMESTFIAIMFFGWNKVSKGVHLLATWLTAVGANLSALWILVANGWMQNPTGMHFNPETARNEMHSFGEVLFNPVAVDKFLHSISSGFVLSAVFVIGVSAWYLLKGRETVFARKSIAVAAVFGLLSSLFLAFTGDSSTRTIVTTQPMKFAAAEGLYDGKEGAGLELIAPGGAIEIPGVASFLAKWSFSAYVPGINDLLNGDPEHGIMGAKEKIERGKVAIRRLKDFQVARASAAAGKAEADAIKAEFASKEFQQEYFRYYGYGFIDDPEFLVPPVGLTFYSFRLMVGLGFYFIVFFALTLLFLLKKTLTRRRKFLKLAIWSIPLAYIAGQAGWIVAEVGRQPWAIQDLLPTTVAVTKIDAASVQFTFFLFLVIFTTLLIAELRILFRQIKLGPKNEGGTK
ncbi:MAG: cytochrome ubiquinol oxidase subunit I [Bacteroidales bacterium]|jgi:cytochrome d ubiquinol oxidase subunit I|nr:cytochrome ubiquinol oxidase subunit I [Bacteroidales bacterium]